MSDAQKRTEVRAFLRGRPDLRSAVIRLQALYNPEMLAVLFGMAERSRG